MAEFNITPYVIGILGLLSLFISNCLVPMIRSKLNLNQQEILQAASRTVVYAAEQLFGTKKGEEKLAYATERLQERLKKYGIKMDNGAIRPYIEAAVKALKFEQEAQETDA